MTSAKPRKLLLSDLIINRTSLRTLYKASDEQCRQCSPWGQRKLLLSEIEFFTIYWDSSQIPNPVCVYVGAAQGNHIPLLSEMFPSFEFHLYDPAKFAIAATEKIKIFNEPFTDEIAQSYAGQDNIFFLSDIRVTDYKNLVKGPAEKRGLYNYDISGNPIGPINLVKEAKKEAEQLNEEYIWKDMTDQQRWLLMINPEHALLKFRLPYALDRKDRTVQYLKGVVFWQLWAPQKSSETRLKPMKNENGQYELDDWSILEYEQWCYHHNIFDRDDTVYMNPFTYDASSVDDPELLNDYDSIAEILVLRMYFEKLGLTETDAIYNATIDMSRLITWSLNNYGGEIKKLKTLSSIRRNPISLRNIAQGNAFSKKTIQYRRSNRPRTTVTLPRQSVIIPDQPVTFVTPADFSSSLVGSRTSGVLTSAVASPKFSTTTVTSASPPSVASPKFSTTIVSSASSAPPIVASSPTAPSVVSPKFTSSSSTAPSVASPKFPTSTSAPSVASPKFTSTSPFPGMKPKSSSPVSSSGTKIPIQMKK